MNTLFIRLQGPLQAWGERARWGQRDTQREPTKSGVIGLVACARGWGSDRDADIRKLNDAVRMGVRVDQMGRVLRDYHTVVGGALSAQGKIKVTATTRQPETVVSDRFYLADASFLVALQGPNVVIDESARALQNPIWPPFLGRRSCPPSHPLFAGTGRHPSLEAALRAHPAPSEYAGEHLRLVLESDRGFQRSDNIDRLSVRTYRPRRVEESAILLETTP